MFNKLKITLFLVLQIFYIDILLCKNFNLDKPLAIVEPDSVEELQNIVKNAYHRKQKISIKGQGQSQGGQILNHQATMIDMKNINKIVNFNKKEKLITVQGGITWREIQKFINSYGLAVKAMQSYSSFSVGGSISVNCHGQDFHSGTVADTIKSLKILLHDGSLVEVNQNTNSELFGLIIGGYGLFGIIIEVTLELTHNYMLEKEVKLLYTDDYENYFLKHIKNNNQVALHSARLSVNPLDFFNKILSITYYSTEKFASNNNFLIESSNVKRDQALFDIMRKNPWTKALRLILEYNIIEKQEKVSRNNAMNNSVENLQSKLPNTKDILQEYFIPANKLNVFIKKLKKILVNHKINILNATIRFVKKQTKVFLNYSPQDSFAIVLYINVKNDHESYMYAQHWTHCLINQALALGGTYYLPYQLFASKDQIRKSYPMFNDFIILKKKYDPNETFINNLYNTYIK